MNRAQFPDTRPHSEQLRHGLSAPEEHHSQPQAAIPPPSTWLSDHLLALAGGAGFFVLALGCLLMLQIEANLVSIWLPDAFAVSLLLLYAPQREGPFYVAIAIADLIANIIAGQAIEAAAIFAFANIVDVVLVVALTRRACGRVPNLRDLAHLGHFLVYGGIVGPIASASIGAIGISLLSDGVLTGLSTWFLADSIGMILWVPACLVVATNLRMANRIATKKLIQDAALMTAALCCVVLVFSQNLHPLLFLLPPITLVMVFRMGASGTAIYVPAIAIIAIWMTYHGHGPIAAAPTSDISKLYIIQVFVAANFIIGLPVAAILSGRARLTREVMEGRRALSLLAENVTDAVLRIDDRGVCTYASPSTRDVLGHAPDDLIEKDITEHMNADASERILGALANLLAGKSERERLTYRRLHDSDDQRPVFIEADCAVACDPMSGKRIGVILCARDVSARVELEEQLTRARYHAEDAARLKSEFLANMSHEIRTPMNGVLGFAELMLQGNLDHEQRRHVEMIVQSGRNMMLLLNDILDLSKMEAGQIAIDAGPVDLFDALSECTALHQANAGKKGITLSFNRETDIGDPARPWVLTDALRLRQIVLNLIGNAVKFTQHGGVEVICDVTDEAFSIAVKDTGIGIGAERMEAIFAPFTQAESETARQYGGTGLGLTISRQLAELLGGTIEVESEPGKGSTFRLICPAQFVEPDNTQNTGGAELPLSEMPPRARILLVEDHDVNRILGTEMLERCGQSVDVAYDGNEALAMVIDSVMRGQPFDLVLMDIQMPGCDGYEATRAIRGEGIGPDIIPIIALTGNAFPEDIRAAREAGMQGHLAKPLEFADLARTLQRWLPTRIVEEGAERRENGHAGIRKLQEEPAKAHGHGESKACTQSITPQPSTHLASTRDSGGVSPSLHDRWTMRRKEALVAVHEALESGLLAKAPADSTPHAVVREELARTVHKLAGTAAMFGEVRLGELAAEFEHALRGNRGDADCEEIARHLLDTAEGATSQEDEGDIAALSGH